MARDKEILRAAAELFHERGYHATTMRELAAHVGIEAPSLYNHFTSKHALLARLLLSTMHSLLDAVRSADQLAGPDPVRRLTAAMAAYVRFHEEFLIEASISDTERRALDPDESRRLLELRDQLAGVLRNIVRDGVEAGRFATDDISLTTLFLLSICARIPVWYRPDGPHDLDKIGDMAIAFALKGLSGPTPEAPS